MAEVARSSGYQHDLVSDLAVHLAGVENISELLTRTSDRCQSEDMKQVKSCHFSVTHYPALYCYPTIHCSRFVSKQSEV